MIKIARLPDPMFAPANLAFCLLTQASFPAVRRR
jgi:hypothetical protein